jgi:hypothetical protein
MEQVGASATGVTANHLLRPIMPPVPEPGELPPGIAEQRRLASETVFDEDRFDAFGPSFDVDGAAARAVAAYDRDGDGSIRLGGLGIMDRSETSRYGEDGRASIRKLAMEADRRGNGDGRATAEEIAEVIDVFDAGEPGMLGGTGDGRLDADERARFLARYGEDTQGWTRPAPKPPSIIPSWPRPDWHDHPRDIQPLHEVRGGSGIQPLDE